MGRKIGVVLSYLLMIFEVLSTLLLTPFILRTLGQAEYGVFKLSAAVTAYMLLLDLGVGNAVTRYVAKFKVEGNIEQSRKFLGIATIYYASIAILAIAIGAILIMIFPTAFAKGLSEYETVLGQKLLGITMLNAAVTLGSAAYNNVILAYEKFVISKGTSIINIIIKISFTYLALKCGMGSIGIVLVNFITTVLCRGFFVLYVLFGLKLIPKFKGIEIGFVKEIVLYSSFILLQMIATQLNSTIDQILIGALVTSSSVVLAVYSVGTQIVQYYQSIGSAFTGVLMPGIVKMVEEKAGSQKLTNEMIRIGRIIFMVLAFVLGGFLVLGRDFIILWAGQENSQSYIVAIILMTAYLFILTESIGTQILWAMNQHREQAILKIVIVLLNIVLTVFLIRINPLIGATIGTFISLVLGDIVVMNIIFVKKIGINLFYYYREIFKGIVPCLFISTIIGFISNTLISGGWGALIFNIAVMCVVYAVTMLMFGLNKYEKKLIISIAQKIFKKSGGK